MTSLKITDMKKVYGRTVALNGVNLDIAAGSSHGIIGENGAGKSTLVKILSGLVQPTEGMMQLGGEKVEFSEPTDAREAGVAVAFQELSLVPDLSVAENLALPKKPRRLAWLTSDSQLLADATEALSEWELDHINPQTPIRNLSLAARQQVEILSAVSRRPRLLILDEPTSALGRAEVEWLFRQVERLRQGGLTIIFVSHRMDETRALCDSATVLRNGQRVGVVENLEQVTDDEIIKMMIGQSIAQVFPDKTANDIDEKPILSVKSLSCGRLSQASVDLHAGEVLGVAGLQDHGQLDLFKAIFGVERPTAGQILIEGRPAKLNSPRDAIRAGVGIGLVPEDRGREGAHLHLSGTANITLPSLREFTKLGWIDRKAESAAVREILDLMQVSPRAQVEPVDAFSGGNQQKIVMGKWILTKAKIMLLYDPTRGVDIGTKSEIYRLIRDLAAKGHAVLFHSTDIEELVNVCDRVIVCYRGRLSSPLVGEEIESSRILRDMLGSGEPAREAV